MANPTITVTPEPGNLPPRIRIDVLDTGTPAVTAVSISRIDPDGTTVPIRSENGATFPLTTSGDTRVGTAYDHEVPYGQAVTYVIAENPSQSAVVTLDVDAVWLIHPGVPSRSMRIRVTDMPKRSRRVKRGVFYPLESPYPVINTDGRRKAPEGVLSVRTETDADRIAMDSILDDAQTLLLNVPPGKQWGVTTMYVAIDTTDEDRFLPWGPHPYRNWTLPYTATRRPSGGAQAQWNLQDVKDGYATLGDIKTAFGTLADLQANTPVGA